MASPPRAARSPALFAGAPPTPLKSASSPLHRLHSRTVTASCRLLPMESACGAAAGARQEPPRCRRSQPACIYRAWHAALQRAYVLATRAVGAWLMLGCHMCWQIFGHAVLASQTTTVQRRPLLLLLAQHASLRRGGTIRSAATSAQSLPRIPK